MLMYPASDPFAHIPPADWQDLPLIVENLKKLAEFNWITAAQIAVPPPSLPQCG